MDALGKVMQGAESFRVRCQRVGGLLASASASASADAEKRKVNKRGRDLEEEEVAFRFIVGVFSLYSRCLFVL